jgi:hypothetical protein
VAMLPSFAKNRALGAKIVGTRSSSRAVEMSSRDAGVTEVNGQGRDGEVTTLAKGKQVGQRHGEMTLPI